MLISLAALGETDAIVCTQNSLNQERHWLQEITTNTDSNTPMGNKVVHQ